MLLRVRLLCQRFLAYFWVNWGRYSGRCCKPPSLAGIDWNEDYRVHRCHETKFYAVNEDAMVFQNIATVHSVSPRGQIKVWVPIATAVWGMSNWIGLGNRWGTDPKWADILLYSGNMALNVFINQRNPILLPQILLGKTSAWVSRWLSYSELLSGVKACLFLMLVSVVVIRVAAHVCTERKRREKPKVDCLRVILGVSLSSGDQTSGLSW